jgi:hypothetical protein
MNKIFASLICYSIMLPMLLSAEQRARSRSQKDPSIVISTNTDTKNQGRTRSSGSKPVMLVAAVEQEELR